MIKTGEPAPPFSLTDATGNRVSLQDLAGRDVVLYFYPKDDTSGCTLEAQNFQALKGEFAAADTEIIGVSPDAMKSHDKFRSKYGLDFALASDEDKTMLEAYGVWVEKSMYGRKYMGIERSTFVIDAAGNVTQVMRKVKPADHADDVLAALS